MLKPHNNYVHLHFFNQSLLTALAVFLLGTTYTTQASLAKEVESGTKISASASVTGPTRAEAEYQAKQINKTVPSVNVRTEDLVPPEKKGGFNPLGFLFRPISDLQKQSIRLQQQIMRLEAPIAGLQKPMFGLQDQMMKVEKEISDMQKQMVGMERNIESMERHVINLERPVRSLHEPLERLQAPMEKLATPLVGVQDQLNSLRKDMNDLKAIITTMCSLILLVIVAAAVAIAVGTPVTAYILWKKRHQIVAALQKDQPVKEKTV
jgi:prefoldin subunit 5